MINNRLVPMICICLAAVSASGCKVTEWFSSRPASAERRLNGPPPIPPSAGYLAGGPTFANVQAVHQPQETAVERAVRLEAENQQLRDAIGQRDREIQMWQQRLEAKDQLLRRVESEISDAVRDVSQASQQMKSHRDELSNLHDQTRQETEANARALESLSKRVEALLNYPKPEPAPAAQRNHPSTQPHFELPAPSP